MFNNHVYGIDLGSNMIKIYSQNSNENLKREKYDRQFATKIPYLPLEMKHMKYTKRIRQM